MLHTYSFTGIGTHWNITVENTTEPKSLWCLVDMTVKDFESRFSRFNPDSLVNQFKSAPAGNYDIDPEFAILLNFAQKLKNASDDKFNPAISELLSLTGYDDQYSFVPKEQEIKKWRLPSWQIDNKSLFIEGPVTFDFGGFGKGYLIDKIAKLIKDQGFEYFLVDGGGDMYGSKKDTYTPWLIAIENPKDTTMAIATIQLKNQALAVSDIFKRRWRNKHHIVDPHQKISSDKIIACSIMAADAITADGLTTCYMLCDRTLWPKLAIEFGCHYLIITSDNDVIVDRSWPGKFV